MTEITDYAHAAWLQERHDAMRFRDDPEPTPPELPTPGQRARAGAALHGLLTAFGFTVPAEWLFDDIGDQVTTDAIAEGLPGTAYEAWEKLMADYAEKPADAATFLVSAVARMEKGKQA